MTDLLRRDNTGAPDGPCQGSMKGWQRARRGGVTAGDPVNRLKDIMEARARAIASA